MHLQTFPTSGSWCRRGCDRMVVGFTTCAISADHHYSCELEFRSWRDILDTTLCDTVCQWLAVGRWFSPGTPVSSTNKTDCHDITEISLKVALDTITIAPKLLQPLHVHVDSDLFVARYIKRLDCLKSFPLGDIARYNCECSQCVTISWTDQTVWVSENDSTISWTVYIVRLYRII